MEKNYATHQDIINLTHKMDMMGSSLSHQITIEVKDTFWKLIPIMIGLMALVNGVFFIAYKMGN